MIKLVLEIAKWEIAALCFKIATGVGWGSGLIINIRSLEIII